MSAKLGDLGDSLKELYTEAMKNIDRGILLSYLNSGPRRKGHWEEDPGERAKFDDFEKRWNALIREGFDNDYLMRDYEGLMINTPPGEWVWDETEEEFRRRAERENCTIGTGGHIVFRTVERGPKP